jgi:hypothetical protein
MADVIHAWTEQLLVDQNSRSEKVVGAWAIPRGIRFISCQKEACVIGKCDDKPGTFCS